MISQCTEYHASFITHSGLTRINPFALGLGKIVTHRAWLACLLQSAGLNIAATVGDGGMKNNLKLAAILALTSCATPVAAQDTPCAGLADALSALVTGGFHAVASGEITGGTVTVYTHDDGRFLVVYADTARACIVQDGQNWGAIKPNV